MRNRHPFLWLALILVLSLPVSRPAWAQEAPNLLQNPGFEGEYQPFAGDVTRLVAPGWSAWNVARRPGEPTWTNITPQYLPSTLRVRGGQRAQELFEVYAIYNGGVFQRVAVVPGSTLRFTAFVNVWSSELDDPAISQRPSPVNIDVGIDPTGGTSGESPSIIWSGAQQFYDEYRPLTVDAVAAGNAITVFVRARFQQPVRHNNVYIDDSSLAVIGGGVTPTPTTRPITATPIATFTPTSTLPPLITPSATFTPSPTDPFVPTREGTLPVTSPTPFPTVPDGSPTPTREGPTPIPTDDFNDLPGRVNYTVQRGDTVSGIAERFNSRVSAIIALNNLRSDGFIVIGQTLVIPVPAAAPTPTRFVPPTATPGGAPVDTAILNGPTVNGIGTYIMQPGDTLEAVARRYRVTLQYLARLNGIVNPARVVIGQVLAVPGPGNNPPGGTAAPTIIPTQPGGGIPGVRTHVVQPGENLFRISLRYNVTLQSLMRLNGIVNPNLIYVGQVLRIP